MLEPLQIQLPEDAMVFVREQAVAHGLRGADEFVQNLVEEARLKAARNSLVESAREGIASPKKRMTTADWERFRNLAGGGPTESPVS